MMNNKNPKIEFTKKGLFFLPLGGVGEIGANCYLYCCDDSWIMIDLGVSFADEKFPGIDILVPKIDFIENIKEKLQCIVISHAHEDHAGAVSYFVDKIKCPIYATTFASKLIQNRLNENKLNNRVDLKVINTKKTLKLKNFNLSFFETTHSIPETYAIKIETQYGNLLHTADWKIDNNPLIGKSFNSSNFKKIGDDGILALIGDSTNANTNGFSGSEIDVKNHLKKLFQRYSYRIVTTCFSSNIARIESIALAAKNNNRKVAIVGRSINRTIKIARECGYLNNVEEFVSQEEAEYIPRENLVIICTGSQGEKRSALFRIAYNAHKYINLEKGDTVIFSSKDIPGNEKSINNLKNLLIRQKVEIITSNEEMVHVSGHASAEELKDMYSWTRPYISIPVHGEPIHLSEHAKIAESCQVPITKILDNGLLYKIAPEKPEIIEKFNTGKMIVQGGKTYNSESDFMKERKKYSYNGIIILTLIINNDYSLNNKTNIDQYGLPINNIIELEDFFKLGFLKEYEVLSDINKKNKELIKSLSKKVIKKFCKDKLKIDPEYNINVIYI